MILILIVASGVIGVAAGFVLAISGGYVRTLTDKSTRTLKKNYAVSRSALNNIVLTTQDPSARLAAEIALRDLITNEID